MHTASVLAQRASTAEFYNAEMWAEALQNPFGKGIGTRLPDSASMLPTYAFPLVLRGTLNAVVPSGAPTATECAFQVFPDPYYGAPQLLSETALGSWNSVQPTGTGAAQPSNLSVLTGNAALYRVVSMGVRVWNTANIQSRGGTWQVYNGLASQYYGGGSGGFSGITSGTLASAQQVLQGDAAALGGKGMFFNWLPLTDRSDLIPFSATTSLGYTACAWRAPAYTTSANSFITDSALLFRATITNNATTSMQLGFEIVWNVETIMFATTDQSFPGKVVAGSASAITTVAAAIENGGAKIIDEQVELPGYAGNSGAERGGVPAGTSKPQSVVESVVHSLADVATDKMIGSIGKGVDLLASLALAKHKVAAFAGYPELSPAWRATDYNTRNPRPNMRKLDVSRLPESQLPMPQWLTWFEQERKLVDEARAHRPGGKHYCPEYHLINTAATPRDITDPTYGDQPLRTHEAFARVRALLPDATTVLETLRAHGAETPMWQATDPLHRLVRPAYLLSRTVLIPEDGEDTTAMDVEDLDDQGTDGVPPPTPASGDGVILDDGSALRRQASAASHQQRSTAQGGGRRNPPPRTG